jgi:hypothetical protein
MWRFLFLSGRALCREGDDFIKGGNNPVIRRGFAEIFANFQNMPGNLRETKNLRLQQMPCPKAG